MSAASTQLYYAYLCELTKEQLGGLHSPELLIRSVDFARIESLQMSNNWKAAGTLLNEEAKRLQDGGAQLLVLATNTMHKLADEMMQGVNIPMIHIADATAQAIQKAGLKRPGLMATRFTMEQRFYLDRLQTAGLDAVVPNKADRATIHTIIYDELCKNFISSESRAHYEIVAQRLIDNGCDSLILGCTEVGMLLGSHNVSVPVFDTTKLHCEAALHAATELE